MTSIDVTAILNEIRENVRLRRIAGDYPPGLENQLELEFEQIMQSTNRVSSVDIDARDHLEEVDAAFKRLRSRYENQKEKYEKQAVSDESDVSVLDPWSYVAPELVEIAYHMMMVVQVLMENAVAQEEADKRLVKELSQHVLDRIAVVDHLAIISQDLEARLLELESKQK